MIVGYARVSSLDQNLDVQLDQLKAAGCEKIFSEKMTGVDRERPEFKAVLAFVREGDVLVVTRLDRFARHTAHFHEVILDLEKRGVDFRCLLQPFDTTSPTGRLMRDMLAAFAAFETDLRKERQRDGIERAKAAGKYSTVDAHGRSLQKWGYVSRLLNANWTYEEVAAKTDIPERTIRRKFPGFTKKAYSRMGKHSKKAYRNGAHAKPTAQPTHPTATEVAEVQATPEPAPKKRGVLDWLSGAAGGELGS